MSNAPDDTVSFALMGQLLTELEERCDTDSEFSLLEILDSFSLSKENHDLLQELVIHHYRLLQERSREFTPEDYLSIFPEHRRYIENLEHLSSLQHSRAFPNQLDFDGDALEKSLPEFQGGELEQLPFEMQLGLRSKMKPVSFKAGEQIIKEGEVGDRLYVCVSGTAKVTIQQSDGHKLRIGKIQPGNVFGEMALMGISQRTATVTAEEETATFTLSKNDFHSLLKSHQDFSNVITTIISERLGNQRRDALSTVTLEGYKISKRLGRGGMAVVYDATCEETGQRVALKMMSHRLHIDQMAREWFNREAKIIASFDHPNIPHLLNRFDAFATAFMVIEFVEGASLSQILSIRGPYDEESILRILAYLVDALEYAHSLGIVHRDVKPANCMIDLNGNVKLMDFGLSVPCFSGDDSTRTVAGTPSYMAPEQLRGDICPESDWFSLGCVTYELITGQRLLSPRNLFELGQRFQNWNVNKILAELPSSYSRLREILSSLLDMKTETRKVHLNGIKEFRKPLEISSWNLDRISLQK